uniref:non-specific serine/threonine protein kinase n=1 Tax=Gadus morhua TaxID=8049 RepID=A0A8C5FD16_GADMO
MTSRRPMTRSYSGNGRTSSFEEEGSSSNRESRNTYLSNVRPENRSTLCSVMAQLTEDIQPSFEKTLKSKAVSENCNVKFTCVVTGYPAPELTWYKDDMQMDRYCGLPKYEINRNGKNHSLQIYNCTLDDAAIYQASASNTKGIVSCSGVLEVGTMSEFLIHQRFFAKLKQKADNKKKDLEGSKKIEDVPKEQTERSPQRPPRKRPVPQPPTKEEPPAVVPVVAAASEPNGASADIEEAPPQTPTAVIIEKKDDTDASPKDNVATKKLKISNGVDGVTASASSSRGHAIVNGRQNSYDGGISLAQFLAETVSAQAVEEKQAGKTCEMDASVQGLNKEDEREKEAKCKEVKEVEKVSVHVQEHERLRVSETELQVETEKERERQTELQRPVVHRTHSPAPKSHRRGHKDHEHHNIQASLTSVLHSVKDFFFGKGKKDSHDHRDNEETEDYNSKTPPKPMKQGEKEPDAPGSEPAKDRPLQPDKLPVERLDVQPQPTPALSPASLRRFLSRAGPRSDSPTALAVPAITVGDSQSDKTGEELSGGSTPTSSLSCESSPRLKRRDSMSLIRSATPEELASGARRKIFVPRSKGEDGGEGAGLAVLGVAEAPYMSPGQARRAALLQSPAGQNIPGVAEAVTRRESPFMSPGQARRASLLQAPTVQNTPGVPDALVKRETPFMSPGQARRAKPAEKEKLDPFKAPQVIRKIRGEPFPDASGHLKLWCQFFNILSDSTVKWYRDEVEILEVQRSGGDESQVALAIVQASSPDCGVYGCTIKNEYGTDTTDFLLSMDILSDMLLKDDLEVGEEVEMTPLRFTKGLADVSCWGDKFFGRIMTKVSHMGEGCAHKACRIKVIYGLDPVFESGSTCIMKVQSPIPYETKEERNLAERNLEMTKQECKIQNMIREYCKIFAAEARVIENFGFSLEVLPQYLMYRPANTVPYATVETDLPGVFLKYCHMDTKGRLITRTSSEVEQKCCTFQHWIHQWTHGNLLVTNLQGVETKLTNIRVATKSKGYQGLTEQGSPELLEQFAAQHQCNYYCGLLGLRSLKAADSLQQPSKIKGSRSPLLQRKLSTSSSPVLQRRGVPSPLTSRKATASPKVPRKAPGTEENNPTAKANPEGTSETVLKS